jgi:hypothetical protein
VSKAHESELKLLHVALTHTGAASTGKLKLSPFKMLYRRSFPEETISNEHSNVEIELAEKHNQLRADEVGP